MKIGVVSDIHGNIPALEAVLDDMPSIDQLVCAGDIVGYNPWPAECVERIREECDVVIQGNHDRTVKTLFKYAGNPMARAGLEYSKAALSEEQLEWLESLEPRTEIADGSFKLAHSHPDPEYLGDYVQPEEFPDLRPYLDAHMGLLIGHTHLQHKTTVDGRLIANPGSVGQPRDNDPAAAYGVLDTEAAEIEMQRVAYDVQRVINRVKESGLPDKTGRRLLTGS